MRPFVFYSFRGSLIFFLYIFLIVLTSILYTDCIQVSNIKKNVSIHFLLFCLSSLDFHLSQSFVVCPD